MALFWTQVRIFFSFIPLALRADDDRMVIAFEVVQDYYQENDSRLKKVAEDLPSPTYPKVEPASPALVMTC